MRKEQIEFMKETTFNIVAEASMEDTAIILEYLKDQLEFMYANEYGEIDDYPKWLMELATILADFEQRNTFNVIELQTFDGITAAYYL